MKFLGTLSFFAMAIGAPVDYANRDAMSLAEGTWEMHPDHVDDVGDFRCDGLALRIRIDRSEMRYYSQIGDVISSADIVSSTLGWFWIRYDSEERLDGNGNPVEWAWFAVDKDKFVWVRRDWYEESGFDHSTAPRRRCLQPTPIS